MAFILVYRGNTPKAVNYAEKAAEILARGDFGLLATLFRFDCATILFQNGQSKKAIAEHHSVLETRLLKLGRSNPMTLHSYAVLGIIYYFDGDLERAEYRPFELPLVEADMLMSP
jgi:ATP/maltotriose-dependent transcriptional regulator MalT